MHRFLLSLLLVCILSDLSAQSAVAYPEEYVIQQKAKVMKDANGADKNPAKFEDINMLWVINESAIGCYPGTDKGGYGTMKGGFINLKKLKPSAGNKSELMADYIGENLNEQPTPVHILIKHQEGKLPYRLIVQFPTYVIFYNAFQRNMFGEKVN